MQLFLGACAPAEASRVLITTELCGLSKEVSIVDSIASAQFVRGRSPALLLDDGETVIFGINTVCHYLQSKTKTPQVVAKPDESTSTTQISLPLSFWNIQSLTEQVGKSDFSKVPKDVLPVFEKFASFRDGRPAQKILTQIVRDAISRAFPACYKEALLPVEVKFDGRKIGKEVIDYCFSGSQQLQVAYKNHPSFDIKSALDVAQRIVSYIDLDNLKWIINKVDVVGIYINIRISESFLQSKVDVYSASQPGTDHIRLSPILKPQRVVIDFSSPNIAKEMHVGHLRSTIIGDSLCRFFEYAGHEVLRVNHLGDWGTQFGMLLTYLEKRETETGEATSTFLNSLSLTGLTKVYKQSKEAFDASDAFKTESRKMVVSLQSGKDPKARKVWEKLVEVSKRGFEINYNLLNVNFDNPAGMAGVGYCGESFYQDKIEDAIKGLGKLVRKRGEALLLFTGLPEAKQPPTEEHPDGEIPLFLRKSDGGYGYDSTDMAAVKFRAEKLQADRVLYVTDVGQQTHFQMVFEAARQAGWVAKTQLDHVKFGVVCAKGGGKFKSRDGGTVPLSELLEEAKTRMKEILLVRIQQEKKTTEKFDQAQIESLSGTIGVSAVKYFDLRTNRVNSYEFDADAMCSPDGDTAVYLMYAYARVCSIIDKAAEAKISETCGYQPEGASDRERSVAFSISRFGEVVELSLATLSPHHLCAYLYNLSSEVSTFLTDDKERVWARRTQDETGPSQIEPGRGMHRLFLVRAVREVLFEGLGLLGITPFDRM